MIGQQRGVILERAELGRVEHRLRHEEEDIRHHADVGVEALHERQRLGRLPAFRLMYRQTLFQGERLQRILGPPGLVGRTADGNDSLASCEQLFEHRLTEGVLSVNHDTHAGFLPECRSSRLCLLPIAALKI